MFKNRFQIILFMSLFIFVGLVYFFKNRAENRTEEVAMSSKSSQALVKNKSTEAQKSISMPQDDVEKSGKPVRATSALQVYSFENKEPYRSLADLQKDFGSNWGVISGDSNGRPYINSILANKTEQPVLDDQNALQFAEKLRPFLGVENSELSLREGAKVPGTIDIVQAVKGYEVYNGNLRFVINEQSSTPIMINNELKPISELNDSMSVSADEAKSIVMEKVVAPALPIKIELKSKPVAYLTADQSGVLAWVVHAEWLAQKSFHSQDILISAADGEVLFTRNLVFN